MSAGCDYFIMEECCDSFDMIEYVQSFDMGINFLLGPPTPSEVIFIPSVDADGWLSWTNDGGLPNPDPVNIKGPPGVGAVESVNGQTGVVELTSVDIGLGNVANERQYSANNPPPYPVKSVDGQTGDVTTFSGDYNDLKNRPALGTIAAENTPLSVGKGGTDATNAVEALLNLKGFDLTRGTKIPDNSDLNNYTTPGVYYVESSANAATIVHGPTTGYGYRLIVQSDGLNNFYHQWVILNNSRLFYCRARNSSTWTGWSYYISSDVLPLGIEGGGTGAATLNDALSNLFFSALGYKASNNNAVVLNFPRNAPVLIFTNYPNAARQAAFLVWGRSTGVPFVLTLASGTGITVDASTAGTLTISSNGEFYCYVVPLTLSAMNNYSFS